VGANVAAGAEPERELAKAASGPAYRGGRLEQPESGTMRVLVPSALRPDEVDLARASETKAAPRRMRKQES
jgi:hypothetical protein